MTSPAAAPVVKVSTPELFGSELWQPALAKYAAATNVTVQLYDTDLRIVFGPIHSTPLFEIFRNGGYDPGLFVECARRCIAQTTHRPAVTVSKVHGLAVVGTSLVLKGKVVGAAVAGYVLLDFSQLAEIERVAMDSRIDFEQLWQVAREQAPVSQKRVTLNGELLQALGDALLRENFRTREYELAVVNLEKTATARDRALHELEQATAVLRVDEERLSKELSIAQHLQRASTLLIEGGNSDKLYQGIVDAAVAITRSDMASVQMLLPERGRGRELQLLASVGFDADAAKFWERVRADSASTCGAALLSGARVGVTDVEKCDFMAGTEDQATYLRAGIRAVQSTPLRSRTGRLLGMISTHWRQPHTPDEHQLAQFDILARQAADVIEREQGRTMLDESEARYRTLFELGPVAIYSCDAYGVIQDYNHVAAELWGREPKPGDTDERWCGSFKMLGPNGIVIPHEQCPMADVLCGKVPEVSDGELQIERPGGSLTTVLVNIRPLKNEQGEISGAINCFVDITERKSAEKSLRDAKKTLEIRVNERTSELETRNTQVLAQSEQLQRLSLRLMQTQDEERRRIARELHDSLGQYLAFAKMSVEALGRADLTTEQSGHLQQAVEILGKCLMEARTISHLLHPPLLDEIGFSSAARWYIDGFSERSGIQANVNIMEVSHRLPSALELALFRVLQESLVNVHRHSHSESVDIQLNFTASDLILEVRDHGQGIPPELLERVKSKSKLGGGVGLSSMGERIKELGGAFEIESGSSGTLIRVTAPVPESPLESEFAFEK
jgi:signal transduction histidine kinase